MTKQMRFLIVWIATSILVIIFVKMDYSFFTLFLTGLLSLLLNEVIDVFVSPSMPSSKPVSHYLCSCPHCQEKVY